MDKNIPLSALIRIGSKQHRQCRRQMVMQQGPETRTCAIGAAYVGKFGELPATASHTTALDACLRGSPWLKVTSPCDFPVEIHSLGDTITCLNDAKGWSREKIADWLESIGL